MKYIFERVLMGFQSHFYRILRAVRKIILSKKIRYDAYYNNIIVFKEVMAFQKFNLLNYLIYMDDTINNK